MLQLAGASPLIVYGDSWLSRLVTCLVAYYISAVPDSCKYSFNFIITDMHCLWLLFSLFVYLQYYSCSITALHVLLLVLLLLRSVGCWCWWEMMTVTGCWSCELGAWAMWICSIKLKDIVLKISVVETTDILGSFFALHLLCSVLHELKTYI